MSRAEYAVGTVYLAIGLGALIWGTVRLRAGLLPRWSGAPARLAESIIGIGVAIGIAQILGTIGIFRRGPVAACLVAFAVVVGLASRPRPARAPPTQATTPRRRSEGAVATFGVVLVVGQWTTQLVDTFRHGMTHADTLWYHGPHAARFLQDGSTTQLLGPRSAQETYYAANSELVHALVMLPFHRDLLGPLVSMGSMALVLLAAWCLGREHGIAPTCTLGAAMVLALPVMAGSQVGQGSTDLPAVALLLAAVALLLREPDNRVVVALSAVAAGLAIGTKPTVAVAIAVITAGVLVHAVRSRRTALGAVWVVSLAVSGSYWYVKNLVTVGNPVPGLRLGIGDASLPLVTARNQCCPVSHYLTNGQAWTDRFLPGLEQALTDVWPLVVGLALLGGVLATLTDRTFLGRVAGVAALAGVVGYVFTPLTAAGFLGSLFTINLRYLTPALFLGCVLLPRCRPVAERGRWWLVAPPFLVALLFGYFAAHYEHAPAWPLPYAVGIGFAVAVLGAIVTLVVPVLSRPRVPASGTARAVAAAVALVVLVVAGFGLQDEYFDHRYRSAGLEGRAYSSPFDHLHDRRVALFGTAVQYPLYGQDLSNVVRKVEPPTPAPARSDRGRRLAACRAWRRAIDEGRFDDVVLVTGTFLPDPDPEPWITTDPSSRIVARGRHSRVVHIHGHLSPADCGRAVRATASGQAGAGASSGTPSR